MRDLSETRSMLLEGARALKPMIQKLEGQMETERHLPDELKRAMLDAGLFRMWIPRDMGGLEVDPLTLFDVVEEVSKVSGSAGWNLMIGSSFGMFAADLEPKAAREIYENPDTILAGQINSVGGRAKKAPGGYRVSGKWAFASGIYQANWVLSNFFLLEDGAPVKGPDGQPICYYFIVPKSDVQVNDVWHTMGLRGSGSNDYAMEDVFVPEARTFIHPGGRLYQDGPLYKITQAFGHVIPVPLVGMAFGALDAFKEVVTVRKYQSGDKWSDDPIVQRGCVLAEGLARNARAGLWNIVGEMYNDACNGVAIRPEQLQWAAMASVQAGQRAVEAVDLIFEMTGGSAVYQKNPNERRFRDVHTGRAHYSFSHERARMLGNLVLNGERRAAVVPQG